MTKEKGYRPFHAHLPYRAREALVWAHTVQLWILQDKPELRIMRLPIPTQIEEKQEGHFKIFFSGGVNIWVNMTKKKNKDDEDIWEATYAKVRFKVGDVENPDKIEMVWDGPELNKLARLKMTLRTM